MTRQSASCSRAPLPRAVLPRAVLGLAALGSLTLALSRTARTSDPASGPVPRQGADTPQQLPGLAVRRQRQIRDPVDLAARLFRAVYTDAMPEPGSEGGFAFSPDRKQLAFVFQYYGHMVASEQGQVQIQNLEDGSQRVFQAAAWARKPHAYVSVDWSRDGKRLIVASRGPQPGERAPYALWSCRLDGTGLQRLTPPSLSARDLSVSPDGKRVAFVRYPFLWPVGDLYVMDLATRKARRLAPGAEGLPRWSPDGKQIAFLQSASAKEGLRLATISADGRSRRVILTQEALRRAYPLASLQLNRLCWLPGQQGLLFTGPQGNPPQYYIWNVSLTGKPVRLGPGESLASSRDGRTLLLKLGGSYWLAELAARPVAAR